VGGPYGVGERISIAHTRAIVSAVVEGKLRGTSTHRDPVFGVEIPDQVPGVPTEVLDPRSAWPDPADYDLQAAKLRKMFDDNYERIEEGSDAG
jgi:phosphoenolpyruvate carboxykinase (ATP)